MAESTVKVIFQAVDKMSGDAKKMDMSLKNIGSSAGIAIAAIASAALALKQAFDFSREGAEMLRLEQASGAMAAQFGQDMKDIVSAMREASRETVDDMTLMAAASRAMQLGVAKTPEDFEKLTTASIALGRAMGRGPADAINDIVTGIGRMSPLILDNLGILTNGGQVFEDYAKSVGKTADSLTDAEKKQALLNITMQSAVPLLDENGELINDAATSWDRLATSFDNAMDNIKQGVAEAILPEIDATFAAKDATREFAAAMDTLSYKVDGVERNRVKLTDGTIVTRGQFLKMAEDANVLNVMLEGTGDKFGDMATSAGKARDNIFDLSVAEALELAQAASAAGDDALEQRYLAQARAAWQAKRNIDAYMKSAQASLELGAFALDSGGRKDVSERTLRDELKDMQ